MEQLRKEVREAGWFAHLAAVLAVVSLLVALVGSSTTWLVANRDADHAATARANLHEQDIKSCNSRHKLAHTFIVYLEASNARSEKLLSTPGALRGLSAQVIRNSRQSVRQTHRLLDDLRAADCDPNNPNDVVPLYPKKS